LTKGRRDDGEYGAAGTRPSRRFLDVAEESASPNLNAEAELDRIDNGDPTCSIAPPDAAVRPVAAARLARAEWTPADSRFIA
jgi:hypothetical protein